ncbi:MAG: tetraacyldisaccharide 4'-kinase, partial [Rectinema sp.]|nr:tetraacyldisaccharide 4'-kinase [Rectinema sp.]
MCIRDSVQRAGMCWRQMQKTVRVDARVISFGNLTAGGSGKTPAVIERAEKEIAAGARTAVLTRGYGGRTVQEPLVCLPGEVADATLLGDEAALVRRRVPEATIIRAANRVQGAKAAIAAGCTTLLLDDGYQYVRLARDENILCVNAANPWGNGHLIPRGVLREPLSALQRATHLLLTHCDHAADLTGLFETLRAYCPHTPVRCAIHAPQFLLRADASEKIPLDALRNAEVVPVCGIAHPEGFHRALERLGAYIIARHTYPDHAPIPAEAWRGPGVKITTEKDAARMGTLPPETLILVMALRDFEGD